MPLLQRENNMSDFKGHAAATPIPLPKLSETHQREASEAMAKFSATCKAAFDGSARAEALELVEAYAQDIVDAWPTLTMRTLGTMTQRIETLKQALQAAKK